MPSASTCSNTLYLPVTHFDNYESAICCLNIVCFCKLSKDQSKKVQKTGLSFIPPFSRRQSLLTTPRFDDEEIAKFQKWFEEGYDLPNDQY